MRPSSPAVPAVSGRRWYSTSRFLMAWEPEVERKFSVMSKSHSDQTIVKVEILNIWESKLFWVEFHCVSGRTTQYGCGTFCMHSTAHTTLLMLKQTHTYAIMIWHKQPRHAEAHTWSPPCNRHHQTHSTQFSISLKSQFTRLRSFARYVSLPPFSHAYLNLVTHSIRSATHICIDYHKHLPA